MSASLTSRPTLIAVDVPADHQPSASPDPKALFSRLAAFSARHRRGVIAVWLLVAFAAAPLAVTLTRALSGAGWEAQGSTAQQVRDELRRDFPQLGAEDPVVAYHQSAPIATNPAGLTALVAALHNAPSTKAVANPLTMPPSAGLISPDGHTAIIPVAQVVKNDAARPVAAGRLGSYVDKLRLTPGAKAAVTGEWAVWSDFNKVNAEALHKAELLSGIPSLILLFLAFGTAIAAGLPLLLALAGIAVGFALLHVLGWATPMSVWSMNFSMMIGLAVGIDYSLFIVSRYREERVDGKHALGAIENTMSTAGKAVFLSALTVVMALSAVFLVPVMVFRSMSLGMILSVVAVAAASLTLLPAILVALGDRVLVKKDAKDPDITAESRWTRWTGVALRRPGAVLALGLVVLGALIAPALGMHLGMPGARVVDTGHTSRDGYDMLTSAFGPGAAAPVFITTPSTDAPTVTRIALQVPGVVDARAATPPAATGRLVVRVTGSTPVDSPTTATLVNTLRSRLATAVPDARVGGPAAQNRDLTAVLTGRAPYAIGLILIVAFLLLLVVFRSLVVALTSIAMNLLTVGAAFGFATVVFQHGFATGLLGIHHQPFVDAWAPLFFFALLFGLSMDYQLFLLAAIRERYERTGNTRQAIAEGIARTGRPITNAALIMIVVFIAFGVTGPIPPTELGLTLAMAVLLDATVVRVLLVPATMALIGDRNWYLPKWLDRALPHIHFSH
jgi:RND superfamily putative drug exporter